MYGATAAKGFRFLKWEHAASITAVGRLIQEVVNHRIDAELNSLFGMNFKGWIIYGDTDSCSASTEINIDGNLTKISDFFDAVSSTGNYVIKDDHNKNYVIALENFSTPSVDDNLNVVNSPVSYVMKHSVKKKMYRVTVGGKQVEITEDHSIMVVRDGKLIGVKPGDILEGDEMVYAE